MTPTLLLFLIRVVSAIALLVFLGLIFWYLYRDLKLSRSLGGRPLAAIGMIRILTNPTANPPENSLLELAPVTSIGRNSRNTIVLDDTYVSSDHALLTWRENQWWLEDLHSRNGTLLNDVAINDPIVVAAGDIITVGGIRMKIELPGRREAEESESGIRDSNP